MRTNRLSRRTSRVIPFVAAGVAVAALASPPAALAAFPTDGGRIVVSDGGGISTSVWPDGTHSRTESDFPSQSKVDGWHAGGSKLVFTDGGSVAYQLTDGSPTITFWESPMQTPVAGAAISPDGNRVAVSTDTAVMLLDGTSSPEVVYEAPAGRIAWSAQTNEGTLVWDGFGVVSDPGIPGGGDLADPITGNEGLGSGAGIWMRQDGAVPVEVVTEASATNPSISQNGRLIAWEQDGPSGGTDIFYLDPTEQHPVAHHLANSTTGSDIMPAVSPDGTQIAFVSDETGTQTLRIANLNGQPGSIVRTEPDGITGVAWQPVVKAVAGSVSIHGTVADGETVTAIGDPSSGTAPVSDSYAWERCAVVPDPDSGPCDQVGVGQTYTIADADRGHRLRVVKTAKNPARADVVASERTIIVPSGTASPDKDGDGVDNAQDAYPRNPNESVDTDGDGIGDNSDNCVSAANARQLDQDNDVIGDACDSDRDGDNVDNAQDAYPRNPDESVDTDGDGIGDNGDNCANTRNNQQRDADHDDIGDLCDDDRDGDGVNNAQDAYPRNPNESVDTDGDGIGDNDDNCPTVRNARQRDADHNGTGDACEADDA